MSSLSSVPTEYTDEKFTSLEVRKANFMLSGSGKLWDVKSALALKGANF